MRRIVAGLVLLVLLSTTACSGGSSEEGPQAEPRQATIADVEVTGDFGQEPTVDFKAPLTFQETESQTLVKGPGKGQAVTADSLVTIDYSLLNASDRAEVDSSWDDEPVTFPLTGEQQVFAGLVKGLEGARPGDRVLVTVAPEDSFPSGNGGSIRKDDSLVVVADVLKSKTPQPVKAADLPELTLNRNDEPVKFVAQPSTPETLEALGVETLISGDGPPITADSSLTVEYVGQLYPDGEVFDESWSKKQPVELSMSSVIEGWQQGLLGQRVGSRVVLTIPSALGYGAAGSPDGTIPPNADLIFSVDILKAK